MLARTMTVNVKREDDNYYENVLAYIHAGVGLEQFHFDRYQYQIHIMKPVPGTLCQPMEVLP